MSKLVDKHIPTGIINGSFLPANKAREAILEIAITLVSNKNLCLSF